MKIGIDIDDTISETYETLFPYAQKYTIEDLGKSGKNEVNQECLTHFYIEAMHKWNEKEDNEFWNKYYKKLITEVNIKTFAKETLEKLHENNKSILITARGENENGTIEKLTKDWLKQKEVPYDELILNATDKVKFAKEHNLDLFIDDSFANCKNISELGIKTFLMDSRMNKTYHDDKVKRVFSWPHIYEEYEKLLKGDK